MYVSISIINVNYVEIIIIIYRLCPPVTLIVTGMIMMINYSDCDKNTYNKNSSKIGNDHVIVIIILITIAYTLVRIIVIVVIDRYYYYYH